MVLVSLTGMLGYKFVMSRDAMEYGYFIIYSLKMADVRGRNM
jgi:hypothetical protein